MAENKGSASLLEGSAQARLRIAVVSPFIDRKHGTERQVAECLIRLAGDYEFHLYSSRVEDIDTGRFVWHKVPHLPGPHLLGYLWWFAANRMQRWRDGRFRGLKPDLVYSPGINCLDADAIAVHIVFARFHELVKDELQLRGNPMAAWPHIVHRRLYYALIKALERRVYPRPNVSLAPVSRKVAEDLAIYFARTEGVAVVYNGLDLDRFSPERRAALRDSARGALGLQPGDFALLLIGNDWKKKGLRCLLEAVGRVADPRLHVLVVGQDNPAPFLQPIESGGLAARVRFFPLRSDVEFYYAAADVYVGPSLEDAFSLPPAECMACGLPVIVSRSAGVSEIITSGIDGLILEDARDSRTLAQMIAQLAADPEFCRRLGQAAVSAARQCTWERNVQQTRELFERARALKNAR